MPKPYLQDAIDNAISFSKGEEEGFTFFFKEFYAPLSFYAFKITANKELSEEIASAAFIKIWEKHERFDDADSIQKYLYRIVRNDALKYLEKRKREEARGKEVIYLHSNDREKDHFNNIVKAETTRQLLDAINSLPAECSKVFKLLYIEGKSVNEAAQELNVSLSTIKTQKKRGIEALRKRIAFMWSLL